MKVRKLLRMIADDTEIRVTERRQAIDCPEEKSLCNVCLYWNSGFEGRGRCEQDKRIDVYIDRYVGEAGLIPAKLADTGIKTVDAEISDAGKERLVIVV